jgi:protein arginine N-methyltransferase 1
MIEFQRLILGDRRRNELFAEALRRTIVPGETAVADLGSGTGFLSFVASRLGAKRCWLYETSELSELSRAIAKANGISNCTFVRAHSADVEDPPRAHVVISETLGNLALEEGLLQTLQDGKRFLAEGGTIIPQRLRQIVAPVVSPRLFDQLDVWKGIGFDLDWTAARSASLNNVYVRSVKREDLLDAGASARAWDAIDFRGRERSVRRAEVEWRLERDVRLFGFALWWECELLEGAPDLVLSTAPDAPPTHWEQVWLPPAHETGPIDARAGETLRLALECDSRPQVKINLKWRTTLADRRGRIRVDAAQDMQKGLIE